MHATPLDLGALQNRRNQFFLVTQDLGLLHLHFLLLLHLSHLDGFHHNLLLHHIGLNVISLVSLRLLPLYRFQILRALNLQIALRLGLCRKRQSFRHHTLLVSLRFCHGRRA